MLNNSSMLLAFFCTQKTPQEVFIEEVNKVMDLQSVQFHIAI